MNFFTAWVACGGILATQLCRFSSLLGELFLPVGSSPVTGLVPLSDYKGKEGRRGLRGDLNPPPPPPLQARGLTLTHGTTCPEGSCAFPVTNAPRASYPGVTTAF